MAAREYANIVSLVVGDTAYAGLKSGSIARTIEAASSAFTLSITEAWPGQDDPIRVRPGDACEIRLDDDVMLTGWVEDVSPSHSGTTHDVEISGHSKTIDAVECSCVRDDGPLQFNGQTIAQIARTLCKPYDIEVVCDLTDLAKLGRVTAQVDESPFAVIERLAREQAVLITDDPEGRLVLTRLGESRGIDLTHPGNILTAQGMFQVTGRYSEYRIKGQRAGDDQSFGRDVSAAQGTYTDDEWQPRRRVLTMKGEKPMNAEACRRRAEWEAITRAGKSARCEITVQGFREPDGTIYAPNRIHAIDDEVIGVYADMLAVSVTQSFDASGMVTRFGFAPQGAYLFEPVVARRTGKRKVVKGVRAFDGNWKRGAVGKN